VVDKGRLRAQIELGEARTGQYFINELWMYGHLRVFGGLLFQLIDVRKERPGNFRSFRDLELVRAMEVHEWG
jgi:hypothetical protein